MSGFDIKVWRESHNGKAYTVRIGSAWEDKNGVMRLDFDAVPIANKDGKVAAFLEARKPAEARAAGGARPSGGAGDMDDAIPFAPEWR